MSTSIPCACGKSISLEQTRAALRCPNCGRELAADSKDRWGVDRGEQANKRRANPRKHTSRVIFFGIMTLFVIAAPIVWMAGLSLRESFIRKHSAENLKRIALALHKYNDTEGRLPPSVVYDKEGRPLYSWRVLLLPYLNQSASEPYEGFDLSEPWDSPNNREALARMPKIYALPDNPYPPQDFVTHYQVIDGPSAAFDSGLRLRREKLSAEGLIPFQIKTSRGNIVVYESKEISRIPQTFIDGTSSTILIAEADEPVPWTAPQDLDYIPDGPLPKIGELRRSGMFVLALADGHALSVDRRKIEDHILRAALTASAGDFVFPPCE